MRVDDRRLDAFLLNTDATEAVLFSERIALDLRDARALLREAERGLKLDERAIDDNLALAERIRRYLGGEQCG